MQALARYMMRGRVQAIGSIVSLAFLSLIVPPLTILTTAGVALVTLVHGYREGLVNLLVSTAIFAVFTGVMLNQPAFVIEVVFKNWLPAWLLASIVLSKTSMSLAIVVAATLSCLLVLGFYFFTDPAAYWLEVINGQLLPMLKEMGIKFKEGQQTENVWLLMSTIMTGSFLASFLHSKRVRTLWPISWPKSQVC